MKRKQIKGEDASVKINCNRPLELPENFEEVLMRDEEYIRVISADERRRKLERLSRYRHKNPLTAIAKKNATIHDMKDMAMEKIARYKDK